MRLYGIRTKVGHRLLGLAGATTCVDDAGEGPAGERSLTVRASVVVGDFNRAGFFCTDDRDLALTLLGTGRGRRVGDDLVLRPPFGMTGSDLEVVDLVTEAAIPAQLPDCVVPMLQPRRAAA